MRVLSLLLALLPTGLLASELLTNGGFEQSLGTGWVSQQGGVGTVTFDRSTGYDPDPDYEARESLFDGPGWGRLSQTVPVANTALDLSFTANMEAYGGIVACWPAAAVCVEYRNSASAVLGETRFYKYGAGCTWISSPTLHLVDCNATNGWAHYALNVADEIAANLPGVNPTQVARVSVSLYTWTQDG
jgi:hypothetical protein